MTRWASRHEDALRRELEPGEALLGATRVVVTAASSIHAFDVDTPEADRNKGWLHARSNRMRGRAARGRGSRHVRLAVARELGFPLPGSVFILGLSDQRVLFWDATAGMANPKVLAGSFPLEEVASLQLVRRFGMIRLGVLLDAGPMLVVQPLWTRDLHELATAFEAVRN